MPVNYEQLTRQISTIGASLAQQRSRVSAEISAYFDFLRENDGQPGLLQTLQSKISQLKNIRCALPRDEKLLETFSVADEPLTPVEILAADGSQITPNRHHELSYGLLNSAVFRMSTGSGIAPTIVTETLLLEKVTREDLDQSVEDAIAMQRDLAERTLLAREAAALNSELPIIALTDGPLEPFYQRRNSPSFTRQLQGIHDHFSHMAELGIIPAGYIDRPHSDLLLRMLDILRGDLSAESIGKPRDLPVFDAALFEKLLPSGHRSVVFCLISPSVLDMPEAIRLSFFYLNVGTASQPGIVRVEIPEYVAASRSSLNLLQANLLAQCRILPSDPYPYALHRAHEAAVVTSEERDRITQLLINDHLTHGGSNLSKSNKQTAKDRANTRYNHLNS